MAGRRELLTQNPDCRKPGGDRTEKQVGGPEHVHSGRDTQLHLILKSWCKTTGHQKGAGVAGRAGHLGGPWHSHWFDMS